VSDSRKTDQSEPEALDLLEGQLLGAKMNREADEEKLEKVPRWRFKRRAELARQIQRRRRREQSLLGLVDDD
jgi:hypothetical protein